MTIGSEHLLVTDGLAAIPDVLARLEGLRCPRVADAGCGTGASTLAIARALLDAHVDGIDADCGCLARARARAYATGLDGRVRFVCGHVGVLAPGLAALEEPVRAQVRRWIDRKDRGGLTRALADRTGDAASLLHLPFVIGRRDALEAALRSGKLAGAGLDVLPVEPPVEPIPGLLRAYRERADWTIGRLIITPHSAFLTPEAYQDIRIKSAETMRAALFTNRPQNVIAPNSY